MTLELCWLNWPEVERNEVAKRWNKYSREIFDNDSNVNQWPDGFGEMIFQGSFVYISTIDDWDNRWSKYSEWQFAVAFLDNLYIACADLSIDNKLDLLYYWSNDNLGHLRGVLDEILKRKDVVAHDINSLFEKLYPGSYPIPPIDWHWKREHLRES